MSNLPLPMAEPALVAEVHKWLEDFAACVAAVNFRDAYAFWHEDIVIFGTFQELVKSRQSWMETQWSNVWPRTADFAFDIGTVLVMASAAADAVTVVAPWTSTGFHKDGTPFPRPGRATILLQRQPDGRLIGVHCHMSLGKGVPQDSFADRPITR